MLILIYILPYWVSLMVRLLEVATILLLTVHRSSLPRFKVAHKLVHHKVVSTKSMHKKNILSTRKIRLRTVTLHRIQLLPHLAHSLFWSHYELHLMALIPILVLSDTISAHFATLFHSFVASFEGWMSTLEEHMTTFKTHFHPPSHPPIMNNWFYCDYACFSLLDYGWIYFVLEALVFSFGWQTLWISYFGYFLLDLDDVFMTFIWIFYLAWSLPFFECFIMF